MPTALAISSMGASCIPRSSNSARVALTRSRSRSARSVADGCAGIAPGMVRRVWCPHENVRLTVVLKTLGAHRVAERGAVPKVSAGRRRTLSAVRSLLSPLLPDDYLELINPLWSTREVRGRMRQIRPETGDGVTIVIRPGHASPGHEPGQYLR